MADIKFHCWKTSDVISALKQAAHVIEMEQDVIDATHEYAQQFGGQPGGNVFRFLLEDALKDKGWTLDDFIVYRKRRNSRTEGI